MLEHLAAKSISFSLRFLIFALVHHAVDILLRFHDISNLQFATLSGTIPNSIGELYLLGFLYAYFGIIYSLRLCPLPS